MDTKSNHTEHWQMNDPNLTRISFVRVLLVEDNIDDANLFEYYLKQSFGSKYSLTIADRLSTAMAALKKENFDVIISDLALPDSYGLDTVRRLTNASLGTPLIAVTGYGDESLALASLSHGASDFLDKNQIDQQVIRRAIIYNIERSLMQRQLLLSFHRLEESEEKFKKAFQVYPAAVSIFRVSDGQYIDVNESFLTLMGFARKEDILGKTAADLDLFEQAGVHEEVFGQLKQTGRVTFLEKVIQNRSGEKRAVMLFADEILIANESHLIVIIRDLTQQKKAERIQIEFQARLKAEEKFHILFQLSPVALVMANSKGQIKLVNSLAEKLFGYSSSELVGMPMEFLVPDRFRDDHPFSRKSIEEKSGAGKSGPGHDLYGLHKNGTEFPVEIGLTPLETESGIELLSSITDITERKKEADRILWEKEQAEKSSKTKQEFLSVMSHEIRTPLNAVTGMIQLLISDGPRKNQLRNLEILRFSAHNLHRIVSNILDLSKIEAGKIMLEKVDFSLPELIRYLIDSYAPMVDGKSIILSMNLDPEIPERLSGDAGRLTQVIDNLMTNAIKFTEQGEIALSLNLMNESEKEVVISFEVRDSGIGIEPGKQVEIFESFSQGHDALNKMHGGTGLGLSISQKLIEIMGGKISVQSERSRGSVFSFTLGFDKCLASEEAGDKLQFSYFSQALKGKRILLVEDNLTNQEVTGKFITRWGATVDFAENGLQALQEMRGKKFDLVLMDLQMPVMNGYETHAKIRNMGYTATELPVIAVSAYATTDERMRVFEAGMNDYVTKPIDYHDLFRKLIKYTNSKLPDEINADVAGTLAGDSRNIRDLLDSFRADPDFVRRYLSIYEKEFVHLPSLVTAIASEGDVEALSDLIHKSLPSIERLKNEALRSQLHQLRDLVADRTSPPAEIDEVLGAIKKSCEEVMSVLYSLEAEYLTELQK